MSAIVTRGLLRGRRHHLVPVTAIAVLGAVIAAHHGAGLTHGMHHPMGIERSVADMCFAAFAAVGSLVVGLVGGLLALARWRPTAAFTPTALYSSPVPEVRGRDGLPCCARCASEGLDRQLIRRAHARDIEACPPIDAEGERRCRT